MTRTKAVAILRDFIYNNATNEGRDEDTGEGLMDVLDWLNDELWRVKAALRYFRVPLVAGVEPRRMTRRQRKQRKAARLTGLANLCRKLANVNRRWSASSLAGRWGSHRLYLQEAANWAARAKAYLAERDRND